MIGIETDRGLWVQALAAAGYQVIGINPLAVARYRDRHHVSGAKSDACDAKVLADLVRTDRHNHSPIAGDSPAAEAIKVLARGHQNLIWARTRHTNATASRAARVLPGCTEAFDDLHDRDALAVLGRAPTPLKAAHRACQRSGQRSNTLGDNATSMPAPRRSPQRCAPSSSPRPPQSPPRSPRPPAPRWASSSS